MRSRSMPRIYENLLESLPRTCLRMRVPFNCDRLNEKKLEKKFKIITTSIENIQTMSQCFRTISSKLPPFVGTRKQVTQFDRQLPKHIKSSTFLEEFLRTRNVLNAAVTLIRESSESNKNFPLFLSFQNQSISSLDNSAITLKENCQRGSRITKFKEFKDSVVKPIDTSLEAKWRNNRQKITRKQHSKSLQEVHLKRSSIMINDHILNQIIPIDIENTTVLLTSGGQNLQTEKKKEFSRDGKPSQEQLEIVFNNLRDELPFLFVRVMDYSVYHSDIEFVNNIRGVVTRGMFGYVKQVALLRTIGHLKFAYLKFDILKITMHPEDDSIKVRWRIRGLPGLKVFVTFWKFKFWKISEAIQRDQETWYDGFSTFYVDGEGKIYKHVADKMMPDQDSVLPKDKTAIAAKLALFLGVEDLRHTFPDASSTISNLGNFFFQSGKVKDFEKAMLKMK